MFRQLRDLLFPQAYDLTKKRPARAGGTEMGVPANGAAPTTAVPSSDAQGAPPRT